MNDNWMDEDETRWVAVGQQDEWAPGSQRQVAIGARRIGVYRTDSTTWYAIKDRCPHAGASLSEGRCEDGHAVCPLHGWKFDLATGTGPNDCHVATYPVRIVDDTVEVGV